MDRDSIFGIDPDQMNQLLSIGAEGIDLPDEQNKKLLIERDAASKEKPSLSASTDSAITTFESNGGQIGSYKLLNVLGEGGMGIVYLAEQEQPIRRQVALKVIKPGMDTKQVIARFEAERQALALLDHPNIAHVYEAGTTEAGRPYFVMEYVKGLPITEHCDRHKLSIEDRLNLFTQICQAVQHAHQKGIIHRDIKSSNILICRQDEQWVPKIIDFGVAKAIGKSLTEHTLSTEDSQLLGTPEYMSPEQADMACEDIDTRSDVYSLGVLLYVLLTGVLPFDAKVLREGGLEHIRHIIHDQEPKTPATRLSSLGEEGKVVALNRRTDLKTLIRDLHTELEWIPLKAMRKERQHRYQSAAELAQDIRNYLNGAALNAGPLSKSYRIKKFLKRNRTLVSAATIVSLTIIIGSVVSLAMYIRAEVHAQRSQAVSSFLNDSVLSALDPTRPQGGEITVLSVLNAVSDALEGRFTDTPLIEAEVRQRLGLNYLRNDAYDRAEIHLRRAVDIRRNELGDDHPATITSMFELGSALSNQGYCGEAQLLLLRAVAGWTRLLGEENAQTLYAKTRLALNYWYLGQIDLAVQLYQEVLNAARRVGGDESSNSILAMLYIGIMSGQQGNYSNAEKWLFKALQLSQRVKGEDHAWTSDSLGWLGWIYMLQNRYSEAEQALTESVARESRIFGEGHWQTTQDIVNLVILYATWGKLEEASKWRAKLVAAKSADAGSLLGSIHYDETRDMYSIRASGMDIWDIFDEFYFAYKTLQGDGSITARIDSIENTDPWAKCGIMIRKTLEPTSEHASLFITPTDIAAFQYRDGPRGITSNRAEQVGLPHWIRLTRRGNTFTAEHSGDGTYWEKVNYQDQDGFSPVEITMDETVYIGLALCSHNAGRAADAKISRVTYSGHINPVGPFTESQDIGLQAMLPGTIDSLTIIEDVKDNSTLAHSDPSLQVINGELSSDDMDTLVMRHGGSVGRIHLDQAGNTYTVLGSGRDIWDKSDQFHYAWKKLDGDGSIVARVESIEFTNPWAKAGIMIRDSTDANSVQADLILTPTGRIMFQYRKAVDTDTNATKTEEGAVTLPHWIRLTREGDLITAQHSTDGKKWSKIEGDVPGSASSISIPMHKTVYIGLAVTSHAGPFVTSDVKISNVSVTGNVSPAGDFLWSEDIGFRAVALPTK